MIKIRSTITDNSTGSAESIVLKPIAFFEFLTTKKGAGR